MTPTFRLTDQQAAFTRLLGAKQRHTLAVGGSRSGKTFAIVRAICVRAMRSGASRHAILRLRYNAVRASIWLDTLPKVMRLCWPHVPLVPQRQDGYVEFPNGSQIWFGGLDEKDRVDKILGQEYATLYFNECSQIPQASVLVALTRLAQQASGLRNRAYYDLNPVGTGHWTYRQFIEHRDPISGESLSNPDDFASMYLNPDGNRENLDPEYLKSLAALPERQRRRFYEGRYVAEIDGALWTLGLIEQSRAAEDDLPAMRRVVVAIDPSGTSGPEDKRSDEVGIIVAGLGADDVGYVIADLSGRYSPEGWAKVAVAAMADYQGDRIVAEGNYGGDMVRAVIHNVEPFAPYKQVTATRGKTVRAEPIAALYERNRVRHVGRFPHLEEQMINFSTAGYLGSRSPDRADALVWALTELMGGKVVQPELGPAVAA